MKLRLNNFLFVKHCAKVAGRNTILFVNQCHHLKIAKKEDRIFNVGCQQELPRIFYIVAPKTKHKASKENTDSKQKQTPTE